MFQSLLSFVNSKVSELLQGNWEKNNNKIKGDFWKKVEGGLVVLYNRGKLSYDRFKILGDVLECKGNILSMEETRQIIRGKQGQKSIRASIRRILGSIEGGSNPVVPSEEGSNSVV